MRDGNPCPESSPHGSVASANWRSAPVTGKEQILLGSRQVPPFRKSDGPQAQLMAATVLPFHSWKGNLCSAPHIGPTAKRVSVLTAASCWLLYKTTSLCQSWAAAAGVTRGAACRVGTPRAKSLWRHWGALHMLTAGGGAHESPIIHIPRGCPKTSGNQHGQRALALPGAGSCSHGVPSLVLCASGPLGTWPNLCLPEPRRTGRLLRDP